MHHFTRANRREEIRRGEESRAWIPWINSGDKGKTVCLLYRENADMIPENLTTECSLRPFADKSYRHSSTDLQRFSGSKRVYRISENGIWSKTKS